MRFRLKSASSGRTLLRSQTRSAPLKLPTEPRSTTRPLLASSCVVVLGVSFLIVSVQRPSAAAASHIDEGSRYVTSLDEMVVGGRDLTTLAGRLPIYAFSQGDCRELLICRLLLIKVGREKAHDVVVAECLGPGDERPITGDLIVLHGLRGTHDRCV